MHTPYATETIPETLRRVLRQIGRLLDQEVALARAEISREAQNARRIGLMLAVGVGALMFGGVGITVGIIGGLAQLLGMPGWAVYGIIAVPVFVIGGFLFSTALQR